MAKTGIDGTRKLQPLFAEAYNSEGWALCIGAGTSGPIFPSWVELSQQLFSGTTTGIDPVVADETFNQLASRYSPDAMLEACRDRLGISDNKFAELLVDKLYTPSSKMMSPSDYQIFLECLASRAPGSMSDPKWKEFKKLTTLYLNKTSAFRLAGPVYKACLNDMPPRAILSFNAEPLFFTLLSHAIWEQLWKLGSKRSKDATPKAVFRMVPRSVFANVYGRIPYYFIHGLLPVPVRKRKHTVLSSEDKLVFTETAYLSLANSVYSWQAATFLNTCASHKVLFVGVSLSDSNMRRWLAWVHFNRLRELQELGKPVNSSTHHVWINTIKPELDMRWLEALVAPLGIRILWIQDWNELEATVEHLFGL